MSNPQRLLLIATLVFLSSWLLYSRGRDNGPMPRMYIDGTAAAFSMTKAVDECEGFKTKFSTYEEAIAYVRSAPFKVKKKTPLKSSWLASVEYYTCKRIDGYLIIVLKSGKEYIHKNVPFEIWQDFLEAESAGSYYDKNIKGKYRLELLR